MSERNDSVEGKEDEEKMVKSERQRKKQERNNNERQKERINKQNIFTGRRGTQKKREGIAYEKCTEQ